MPELPEVETVRRGLEPVLTGRRLTNVEQRRPDLRWPLPPNFAERLTGRRILGLDRRGKYLLIGLDRDETWIMHLGMSGRVLIAPRPAADAEPPTGARGMVGTFHRACAAAGAHDHLIFGTEDSAVVTYNDARRFGAMDLCPTATLDAHPWLARLGPEPLSNAFSGAALAGRLAGRMTPVKAALLDQRTVAGLGNIYVCEALWKAALHPGRIAGKISDRRVERLAAAVVDVLGRAILAGGSSLRDYRQADGELGYFQHTFRVYDREGRPCPRPGCRGTVRRIVQAGRSTFYCPRCQR